jgi:Uracil DNA glycosylase superfamily
MGEPLALASPRKVPDVISPDLDVLFLGVNPGLRSGAVGHHFAHPSSRFWKALHASGFTPRLLSAFEEADLLGFGLGLTNLVDRTTASARDLHREELREGARRLEATAMGSSTRHRSLPKGVRSPRGAARRPARPNRHLLGLGPAGAERSQRALPDASGDRGISALPPGGFFRRIVVHIRSAGVLGPSARVLKAYCAASALGIRSDAALMRRR